MKNFVLKTLARAAITVGFAAAAFAADKKIVLIAGSPSHRAGAHEHRAGCLLFQKCLQGFPRVNVVVYDNGWPTRQQDGKTIDDHAALEGAAAIVIYSDGGAKHPLLVGERLATLGALVKNGAGFGAIHYAVEPTIALGQKEFLDWMGGAFEVNWSVNPHWDGHFAKLPEHAVTRGVKPFTTRDEWYFNMRFRPDMKGVTPILTAVPPADTTSRADGAHSGNPTVRELVARGVPQHVMWLADNPGGGRGFGFTGGHLHVSWGNDDQRKLVLNAILWLAKVDVPALGVVSTVSAAELAANLDPKPAATKKR